MFTMFSDSFVITPAWSPKEIMQRLRKSREVRFNIRQYDMWIRNPLIIKVPFSFDPVLSKRTIDLGHLQDLCNKPVALYWADDEKTYAPTIYRHVMQLWATNGNLHKTDIEFGRFFAKFIRLSKEPGKTFTRNIQLICDTHVSLLREYEFGLDEFKVKRSTEEEDIARQGLYLVNRVQSQFYILRPSFRALFVVLIKQVSDMDEQSVILVRTGQTAGLSAPIVFPGEDGEKARLVVMKLTDAVNFIVDIDSREEAASPPTRNITILDKSLDDHEMKARRWGYTGRRIKGPSTKWLPEKSKDVTECASIPNTLGNLVCGRRSARRR